MPAICFNGSIFEETQPVLLAGNNGFKYGDGIFETARLRNGKLLLEELHFERLFAGLQLLQINAAPLDKQILLTHIQELSEKNDCTASARIRLAVYRENESCGYILEAAPLEESVFPWQEKGYRIDIYPEVRKALDAFANLKSANYLPYLMASRYAMEKGLDEALVLNALGNICDGSKTNVFLMKGAKIQTPALDQGCVSGVMRRFLIESLAAQGIVVEETSITETDLLEADALFLTNAIRCICRVERFRDKTYSAEPVKRIYARCIQQTRDLNCW